MRCQNCQDEEATVHISGTETTVPRSGAESSEEEFILHFCPSCAEEYRRTKSSQSLFPGLHEEPIRERVRVMTVTPERTVLRLIRTETDPMPEDWNLLTARVGRTWPVGTEIAIAFTPSELEWLRGHRELS